MMKILKLLTATILLSAFSHSAFADEQADAQMITNSTFCAMYSTRLTQTSDSGLQVKGVKPLTRYTVTARKALTAITPCLNTCNSS
ncbi:hypothetical protein [Enterobacter roggenkampii]|uniref:hypothetical protein n=1 Tax=Enterobacter roggenkampii TaxID=1812935 RepID=UPI002FD184FF